MATYPVAARNINPNPDRRPSTCPSVPSDSPVSASLRTGPCTGSAAAQAAGSQGHCGQAVLLSCQSLLVYQTDMGSGLITGQDNHPQQVGQARPNIPFTRPHPTAKGLTALRHPPDRKQSCLQHTWPLGRRVVGKEWFRAPGLGWSDKDALRMRAQVLTSLGAPRTVTRKP